MNGHSPQLQVYITRLVSLKCCWLDSSVVKASILRVGGQGFESQQKPDERFSFWVFFQLLCTSLHTIEAVNAVLSHLLVTRVFMHALLLLISLRFECPWTFRGAWRVVDCSNLHDLCTILKLLLPASSCCKDHGGFISLRRSTPHGNPTDIRTEVKSTVKAYHRRRPSSSSYAPSTVSRHFGAETKNKIPHKEHSTS